MIETARKQGYRRGLPYFYLTSWELNFANLGEANFARRKLCEFIRQYFRHIVSMLYDSGKRGFIVGNKFCIVYFHSAIIHSSFL